jgi:ABC-type dipeptide/oligopeptide/nickel transport system permease component
MEFKQLIPYSVIVVSLAVIVVVSIAVLTGYKDTGLVDNTAVDKFIAGLVVFGTFIGVIVLALVGKIIIGMFYKGKEI